MCGMVKRQMRLLAITLDAWHGSCTQTLITASRYPARWVRYWKAPVSTVVFVSSGCPTGLLKVGEAFRRSSSEKQPQLSQLLPLSAIVFSTIANGQVSLKISL